MEDMHISLLSAAIAAIMVIWLGARCGKVRMSDKVLHGDGGNALLQRRMRAQANFVEYTPFVLIMVVLLDLMDFEMWILGPTALVYFLARILHAIGMDADYPAKTRQIGIIATFLILIGLALACVLTALRLI